MLWDADNRLVMCNSKYQQLHGRAGRARSRARPTPTSIGRGPQAAGPVARWSPSGRPEEGARTFELQLEDGRWLQINERRTKDGGFVSVGTDITQLKRHEGS